VPAIGRIVKDVRGPGQGCAVVIGKIRLNVSFDALTVALLRVFQVGGQAQGEAVAVNPNLPVPDGVAELVCLVADVGGKGGAVERERVMSDEG
jgi:hypothetical protein